MTKIHEGREPVERVKSLSNLTFLFKAKQILRTLLTNLTMGSRDEFEPVTRADCIFTANLPPVLWKTDSQII